MSAEKPRPFELEDEEGEPRAPPSPQDVPSEEETPAPRPAQRGRAGHEVDVRTVAERRGTAVAPVAGRRAPPPGWPAEALLFPLRRPGPPLLVGAALLLAALDVLGRWGDVAFLGWLLKVLALPFFLRWHVHTASMTAGGRDRPAPWLGAMEMGSEHLRALGRLLVIAVLLLLPGCLVLALDGFALGLALLVVGSLWLSVAALGLAVGDPGLAWPWRALAWIASRPLVVGGAALGWWAAGAAEWAAVRLTSLPFGSFVGLLVLLRLAFLYAWLVSARALGVLGREWTPWGEDPS